jgi:hypothetical protein
VSGESPELGGDGIYSEPRWFGAKCWKRWLVDGEPAYLEESVYLIRATTEEEAELIASEKAKPDVDSFENECGERVDIVLEGVASVYDSAVPRLRSGSEVFSQLYEVEPDGSIDWAWREETE